MTDRKKELIKNLIFTSEFVSTQEEYIQKLKQSIIEYAPEIEYIPLDDIVDDVLIEITPLYDTYFTEEQLEEIHIMLNSEIYKMFHNADMVSKMKKDGYKVGEKIAMKLTEKIQKYKKEEI